MSAAMQILEEASDHGVEITVVDGSLKCRSTEKLSPELIARLKDKKPEILRLLTEKRRDLVNDDHIENDWIDSNRDFLKLAGFTHEDLFNDGWPVGIVNLTIWGKPGLLVELEGSTLFFTWTTESGKRVTQSCRPER